MPKFQYNKKNKLIVILGPTASGKTKLAVKLASRFSGEIISADSRQIYHKMNIGTGKDIGEYKLVENNKTTAIPYHLINIKNPDDNFSLAEYQKLCYQKMTDIWQQKKIPFLTGGSGLYIEAVLNGYKIPKVEPNMELRKKLENMAMPTLLKKLEQKDDKLYKLTDKKNKRKIIRALEISLSNSQKCRINKPEFKIPNYDFLIIGINVAKEKLAERINARVDKMINEGLTSEVKKIANKYGANTAPLKTIGYNEIIDHLDGKTELDGAVELIKLHTRQFAKRQMTWFHGMERRNAQNKIFWTKNISEARKIIKKFIDK